MPDQPTNRYPSDTTYPFTSSAQSRFRDPSTADEALDLPIGFRLSCPPNIGIRDLGAFLGVDMGGDDRPFEGRRESLLPSGDETPGRRRTMMLVRYWEERSYDSQSPDPSRRHSTHDSSPQHFAPHSTARESTPQQRPNTIFSSSLRDDHDPPDRSHSPLYCPGSHTDHTEGWHEPAGPFESRYGCAPRARHESRTSARNDPESRRPSLPRPRDRPLREVIEAIWQISPEEDSTFSPARPTIPPTDAVPSSRRTNFNERATAEDANSGAPPGEAGDSPTSEGSGNVASPPPAYEALPPLFTTPSDFYRGYGATSRYSAPASAPTTAGFGGGLGRIGRFSFENAVPVTRPESPSNNNDEIDRDREDDMRDISSSRSNLDASDDRDFVIHTIENRLAELQQRLTRTMCIDFSKRSSLHRKIRELRELKMEVEGQSW